MNKKKVYSLMLLLSLMFILVCMQQLFREKIREVAIVNNINDFKEYSLEDGRYKISLPEKWSIESLDSKESNFHIKFTDNKSIEGNITIQNDVKNIKDVVDSILVNNKNARYNVYNEYGVDWHVVDYYKESKGNTYKYKYYYRVYSEEGIVVIEFEFNEDEYKPSMEAVFDKIVKSIDLKLE